MAGEDIASYIRKRIAEGYQIGQIEQELLESGWAEEEIREAEDNVFENRLSNKSITSLASPKKSVNEKIKLIALGLIGIFAIIMIYSAFMMFSIDSGLKTDIKSISVDYTYCRNGEVTFILRNNGGSAIETSKHIKIRRLNDGKIIEWSELIEPGNVGTFKNQCGQQSFSLCRYEIVNTATGEKKIVSVNC